MHGTAALKDHDARTNAINAVKAAFEIIDRNRAFNRSLDPDIGPIDVNIGINSGSALVGMTRFFPFFVIQGLNPLKSRKLSK